MLVAPTSAIASSTIRSSSSSRERLGHELLEHRELALLCLRLLLAATGAERLGRLDAPLALALEHLQLLVLGQRALQLLLGRAERDEDQPQRVAALGVARLHRVLQLVLDPRDQAHPGIPWKLAAENVPVQVEDRLPARLAPQKTISAVIARARPASQSRRRTRACASPRRPENCADLAEGLDVPLGDDEQMDVRLRVDVLDRDEAVGAVDDGRRPSPARSCRRCSQASGGNDPLLRDRAARGRARARRPARRRATASSRRRSRGPGRSTSTTSSRPTFGRQRARHASCDSARSRALRSFFTCGGTGSRRAVAVPGPRRVREDVHLRQPAPRATMRACCANAALVLGREADDHVARQVEVARAARAGAGTSPTV